MIQDTLNALALVSNEKEILCKLKNPPTWYDDVIENFAKKKKQLLSEFAVQVNSSQLKNHISTQQFTSLLEQK